MNAKSKNVFLNRAIFTQEAFDSGALSVLTTLFHRFPEAGDYEVFIWRGGQLRRRLHVSVGADYRDLQLNLDLTAAGEEETRCGCEAESCYTLAEGGVLGFYVSQGTSRYAVKIIQTIDEKKEKRVWLDSQEVIPEGDLFAVTLFRPGVYSVRNTETKSESRIRVSMPKGKGYRADQPTLLQISKDGLFRRRLSRIQAGQSVVFQCNAPARIQIDLIEAQETTREPVRRRRYARGRRPKRKSQR